MITFSGRQNQSKRVEKRGKYFTNFIVTIRQNIEPASLLTVIPVNTEILGIIKGSFVIPVGQAMSPNFLRYSGGILTQETCNVFKRCSFVQFVFNVDTVFKGKMFLIAWYIFTHCFPPSTAVRRRDENIMNI